MFCSVGRKRKGTVYTDTTGALPVLSLDWHHYYVVAYDYDNNFIEAQEVSDLDDKTIVETVQKIFDKIEKNGHNLMLNVLNRQPGSTTVESVLENKQSKCSGSSNTDVQNHLISGFCCTDSE